MDPFFGVMLTDGRELRWIIVGTADAVSTLLGFPLLCNESRPLGLKLTDGRAV
jgi:hypothetical protein